MNLHEKLDRLEEFLFNNPYIVPFMVLLGLLNAPVTTIVLILVYLIARILL